MAPRHDFQLTYGADLDFMLTMTDSADDPWPFSHEATVCIRIGGSKKIAQIDCEWHEPGVAHIHVDHSILDEIKRDTEFQVLTSTPVGGHDDAVFDEPWLVGLLKREVFA